MAGRNGFPASALSFAARSFVLHDFRANRGLSAVATGRRVALLMRSASTPPMVTAMRQPCVKPRRHAAVACMGRAHADAALRPANALADGTRSPKSSQQ
jgi:hypothetical protein